jgi:glutathione S-transferase
MELHYNVASTYSQKALLAFYEKGVEFTPKSINLFDPVARAEYKKLYLLAKIPLLTGDDGLFVPESTIIIEYLENTFPDQGTKLIPDDKVEARRVRFKDRMADFYVNNPVTTLFFDSQKPDEQRDVEAVSKARETLTTMYQYMDDNLKQSAFAQGNSFGMADLAWFAPLFYAQQLHPYTEYSRIGAYFKRLMQRESVQRLMGELLPALESFNVK